MFKDAETTNAAGDILGRIDFQAPLDTADVGWRFGPPDGIVKQDGKFFMDNLDDEATTTFYHEGKTRTLNKQELINLLWGNDDG